MAKIIVMQTVGSTLWECGKLLRSVGLREGKDFLLSSSPPNVKDFLPGETQLFITGSFWGSNNGVVDMVTAAKKQNPRLTTVFFSVNEIASDLFDYQITKSDPDCWERLEKIVQGFLANTKDRNVLKTL